LSKNIKFIALRDILLKDFFSRWNAVMEYAIIKNALRFFRALNYSDKA
jgi:hypothetical protein